MPVIIPDQDKFAFMDTVAVAEKDARTTGFFLALIAPRSDGKAWTMTMATGELSLEPLCAHLFDLAAKALEIKKKREES